MNRCCPGETGYAKRLLDLGSKAPIHVFWRGAPWLGTGRSVAIVGARRASEGGRSLARRLARDVAQRGIAVVSGGALGVDAAAHEGALDGGGPTCVVLPGPLTTPLPVSNRPLFSRVEAAGGTLLSEHEVWPGRQAYFLRNRLVAALADAVVVIEATARSGTRHTAETALSLGRPLYVAPWPKGDPRGEGARALLGSGARVLPASEQLAAELERGFSAELASSASLEDGTGSASARSSVCEPPSAWEPGPASAEDLAVWAALEQPATLERIAAALELPAPAVSRTLGRFELDGWAERVGGRWRRAG